MSELKVNTISEVTGANGVTVDGLSIKDSKLVTANSVIEANMSANSVDSDSYVDGSIDTAHIADLNITTGKIAADAITAAKIADNAVVTAGINADAVTGAKIADDAINSEHYTDGSIDTAHIADAQITTAKLATAVFTAATDIGAAIVDADLFLMDDGAGGTIRKTTAARIKTYAGGAAVMNDLTDVIMDITNFVDGILIQTGSNGSAPTTGTLSGASNDIGIGHDVFKALTSGANNIAIGGLAADGLTTGDANIAIGYGALSGAVTGDDNVAIGRSAGIALTGGTLNVIVGQGAGLGVIGGARNVLVGATAGDDITGGNDNIAIGHNTCQNSDDEDQNIAIGSDALGSTGDIDGGEGNIAIGTNAAQDLTTGDYNVVIGDNGGHNITTGNHNVLIGGEAGNTTTGEASTVAIGYNAGKTNIGSNSVYLGRDCVGAGNDHEIVIGYSAVTAGGDTLAFGRTSNIVSNNYATNATFARNSDLHKKTNIENDTLGLNFINNLRTVKFNWKPNSEFPKHYNDYDAKENHMVTDVRMHGMIAQEVKEALDIEGVDTFGGWSEDTDGSQKIAQGMFIHPLIKAVQELSEENKNLKDRLTILENK